MEAALRTVAASPARHRFAVLGAMAEISDPERSHRETARLCGELGITLVALETDLYGVPPVGPAAAAAAVGARGEDVCVLVKGSRAARTERVVELLLD